MAPKRKSGAKTSSVSVVMNALKASDALPADLKSLLGASLPVALSSYKADRHEFETEIIGKGLESLKIAQKAYETEHAAAVSKQNEVVSKGERTKRDAAKTAAEATQTAAQAKVAACEGVKKESAKVAADAESAVKAAQQAEKDSEKGAKKTDATKTALTTAVTTHFAALIEGTFEQAKVKKAAIATVVKLAKDHGDCGNTLAQSFTLACSTGVAHRSAFEATTFETVKGKLDAALGEATKQYEADLAEIEKKKAETAAAQATLAQASAALADAETNLAAAKEELKEAKKGLSQAIAFRAKVWTDMKSACDAQDKLADTIKDFQGVVLPAFTELVEKEAPPPPPVEEAAVEEPPEKRQKTDEEAGGNAD